MDGHDRETLRSSFDFLEEHMCTFGIQVLRIELPDRTSAVHRCSGSRGMFGKASKILVLPIIDIRSSAQKRIAMHRMKLAIPQAVLVIDASDELDRREMLKAERKLAVDISERESGGLGHAGSKKNSAGVRKVDVIPSRLFQSELLLDEVSSCRLDVGVDASDEDRLRTNGRECGVDSRRNTFCQGSQVIPSLN
jgi:hypothetical protein